MADVNRNCSNVTSFSAQVYDCPMSIAPLEVPEGQLCELVAAKSTGEQ
jgi:hypothetical protein